ncbi:glucosaminidase domain-containing protein [Mariniflexile gromovii]|uniref:glucosaminidase domain-containing protein n=1 Tax=Mariniflexile gromovii TaxID=362523 RepID=UPI00293D2C65|nr:glucosaminidase domain-containing protein [Mariniflexile gromovii]
MKKIVVFCLMASFIFSCGSKKAVTKKKSSSRTKTESVVTENHPRDNPKMENGEEVVNGVEVKITSTDEYIALFRAIAQEEMRLYGIPASITLAQGILESNSGKGRLAVEANNHFGIKCHDWTGERIYHDDDASQECFRKYNDSKYSYRDHSLFLTQRSRYAALFKLKKEDYKGWARELRNAGYATDRKYPEKLISLIERYRLHKYDEEVLGDVYVKYEDEIGDFSIYYVERGDTMYSISKKFNMSVEELKAANNLSTTSLSVGQKLKIDKNAKETVAVASKPKASEQPVKVNRYHIVGKGETLYSISKRYDMTVSELQKMNGLKDNALNIGQQLQVKPAN